MLADLLREIGDSSAESEGIAELVVTAIGTGGRHYLCWKTPGGAYRQHHHGLPAALEQWLFPADGRTRDFETLQVIFSGEDAFWASDRHGEVKSEASDYEKKLRRRTTINYLTPPAESRRWTSQLAAGAGVGLPSFGHADTERKRSSTFPSVTPPPMATTAPSNAKQQQQQRSAIQNGMMDPNQIATASPPPPPPPRQIRPRHIRSLSTDPRPPPPTGGYVPLLARNRRMNWATRPRSNEELWTLKECPSPQLPPTSAPMGAGAAAATPPSQQRRDPPRRSSPLRTATTTAGSHRCNCGCHEDAARNSATPSPPPPPPPRPVYADAGIQTDDDLNDDTRPAQGYEDIRSTYNRQPQPRREPEYHHQRDSIYSVTQSEPCWSDHQQRSWYVPNPVMMGRMQDYFRNTNYFLGDSLAPQGMG